MDLSLHKTTSENFQFFNIRLENLNKENLELKDDLEIFKRQNTDYKQQLGKLQQDLDHYKSRFNQSQMTVSNKNLEIKNLKSLQSISSPALPVSKANSIDLTDPSPQHSLSRKPPEHMTKESKPYNEQANGSAEDIYQSLQFNIPQLKKRSTSLFPVTSNPLVTRFTTTVSSGNQQSNEAEDTKHTFMSESNRLISEMFKQEVQNNANLKRKSCSPSETRIGFPAET